MNSSEITSIACPSLTDLVSALSEGERATFNSIFCSSKIPVSSFDTYCSWADDSYTRNCIIDDENFELILLCWNKGQVTPIHDHGGEECWVKIIEGEFKETIFEESPNGGVKALRSSISKANDITYMIDFMGFHSLENISTKRSMSLHLYAKPIRTCKAYDMELGEFVSRDLEYDTIS